MSRVVNLLRRILGSPIPIVEQVKPESHLRDFTRFAAGERVLVNGEKLLEPLKPGKTTEWKHNVRHDDIIGQPVGRLKISSPKGARVTVEQPTLDQFVSLSPRHVTPIYAPYAAFILNHLDIHVPRPSARSPRLEILEAGTGHGSLTLHVARAIAAANEPPPDVEFPKLPQANQLAKLSEADAALTSIWSGWKERRNAIIHTVEFSEVNSRAAERLIRSFRQGLYWPHIDFHVGDVGTWAEKKFLDRGGRPYLDAIVLDVPDVQAQIYRVIPLMKDEARLVVWAASITQICECEKLIEEHNLPLAQDKVFELGSGISDGRIWNVRLTVPRARAGRTLRTSNLGSAPTDSAEGTAELCDTASTLSQGPEKVMICRPKVGERLVGGGFIGIWRKRSK